MPGFSFTTIEPNQIGQVTKWDVPINDWLGLKFGSGQNDTLGNQFRNRVEDDIYDDKSESSVDVLNRAYGIDDRLKFTEPMSIQRARLINERKRKEIEVSSYFESASHSWFSAKAAAGFGAAMVGSLSHPLDLGLSFLPFVGSEKAVAGVAKMGGGQLERMMARGLITEERLAAIGVPLPRLSGAMIDGAVNQLAMEVPIAFQKNRDMANYDSSDFAFNVLAGGAFAGGVKSIGLAFERAAKAWTSLDPKIRDAAPLKALREIFTREPARFDADVKLDEATIRAQVTERVRAENPFDEAAVRAGYDKIVSDTTEMFGRTLPDLPQHRAIEVARMTAKEAAEKFQAAVEAAKGHGRKGSDPSLLSDIDYATALLWRINSGRGEPIIRYESKTAKVGEIFEDAGLTYRVSSVKDGQVVAIQTGSERFSQMYSPELEVIAQKEARGIDLTPEERATVEGLIDPETPNAHSDYQQRVAQLEDELEIPKLMEEQRRLNLEEYVAQKRAEYDARVKDVADAETKKATENIRKQAKSSLTTEEIQKYTVKAPADDAAIKLVEDEADELIKTVLDSVDSVEDRARLEAEINAELERHGFKTEKGSEDMNPPEQGGKSKQLNIESVSKTDETYGLVLDVEKLRLLLDDGKIGSPGGRSLLSFLLKEDSKHPLSRIELIEGKSSKDAGFQGQFSTRRGSNVGLIKVVLSDMAGGRISESQFVRILNHELLHNAVTSKYDFADAKIKDRARRLFMEYVDSVKGTDLESHNSTKSVSEFLADSLSSQKVRDALAKIDYSKKVPLERYGNTDIPDVSQFRGSFFGRILSIVKDVLGIPEKIKDSYSGLEFETVTALDEAVHISEKLRSQKREPIGDLYSMSPPEVGVSAEKAIDAMIPCVTAKAKL